MILRSRFEDYPARTPWPPERRKPVVNGEYALYMRDSRGNGKVDKPNSGSIEQIRRATWDIAMSGGYFVTGFGSTYWGGYCNPRAGFASGDPIDKLWEEQVQHIFDLFTSLEWWKLEPSDYLVHALASTPLERKARSAVAWYLAEPGRQYLVYVRAVKRATVDLEQIGGRYRLTHFDPRTGKRMQLEDVAGGQQTLDAPDPEDHLFLITR